MTKQTHKRLITSLSAALAVTNALANPDIVTAAGLPAEGKLEPFMGEPAMDIRDVFKGERFPNVVVATDGTVLATWGRTSLLVRRSEDGGETWGPEIQVGKGHMGGGVKLISNRFSGDTGTCAGRSA